MDFNIDVRKRQLESLGQFISSSKSKVEMVLKSMNWDVKNTLEENRLITCSLDSSHKVARESVNQHLKKCALKKEGYNLDELFLSEPQNNSKSCIYIDHCTKIENFTRENRLSKTFKSGWNGQDPDPKTSDRLIGTFSSDERLVLYNYAIKSTIGPAKVPEFNVLTPLTSSDQQLSEEERLARERDAKRRRIKYKSVHTNKKNYVEVLREVINGQMNLYNDWLDSVNMNPKTPKILSLESQSCKKEKYKSESSASTPHKCDEKKNRRMMNDYHRNGHNHQRYSEREGYRSNHSSNRREYHRSCDRNLHKHVKEMIRSRSKSRDRRKRSYNKHDNKR